MAEPAAARRRRLVGVAAPRIAPPVPAKSLIREYEAAAKDVGIKLMPWQTTAARYMTARDGKRWRYRNVAVVVSRQNGKTELLLPRILMGLRMGRRMLHTAQNREVPRDTFLRLAELLAGDPLIKAIRWANGQEVIQATNGGKYTLVAPRPGVRGRAVDDVFLDEVREYKTFDLIAGIRPTMTASPDPQIVYLSNAGDADSVVLNDLRRRGEAATDARLAYLEWSAAPERASSDKDGWAEANPALGTTIQLDTLEDAHENLPPAQFETEHLCRWVITTQPKVVPDATWMALRATLEKPLRPFLGISMDISGGRASAALAWQQSDGTIATRVIADVTGDPIDTDRLGADLRDEAIRAGVVQVFYDPVTDSDLARHFRESKTLNGREYANASELFARSVAGGRLRWDGAENVADDLAWAARKPHESGAWMVVKAKADRPITALLATVRAVWQAAGPKQEAPRIY